MAHNLIAFLAVVLAGVTVLLSALLLQLRQRLADQAETNKELRSQQEFKASASAAVITRQYEAEKTRADKLTMELERSEAALAKVQAELAKLTRSAATTE